MRKLNDRAMMRTLGALTNIYSTTRPIVTTCQRMTHLRSASTEDQARTRLARILVDLLPIVGEWHIRLANANDGVRRARAEDLTGACVRREKIENEQHDLVDFAKRRIAEIPKRYQQVARHLCRYGLVHTTEHAADVTSSIETATRQIMYRAAL